MSYPTAAVANNVNGSTVISVITAFQVKAINLLTINGHSDFIG
jgi:hypothetical protein